NFVGPFILTSAGQSADFQMVKAMLKMNKVENYSEDALLNPETMPEEVGTLIIVIGGSSKGLGAAGIDADQELDRLIKVMNFAKEKDIPILAMHIGGAARRGDLSDKFIEPVVAEAKICVVVEEANEMDNLFDALSEKYDVPMIYIAKKTDGAPVLKDLMK
ncbi:MAG: hypothetical protein GX781_08465, partial [Clostridiales bacterium]|nr:hypothetical protein [Clostridiales bacterium]